MAQRTVVEMMDDIDGGEAAETVLFVLDGLSYEIDLSESNAAALRAKLVRFVTAGRRIGGRKARTAHGRLTASQGGSSTSAQSREYNQAVRAWGAANGHELADRGRISAQVIAEYQAQLAAPVEAEPAQPMPETKSVHKRAPRKKKTDATV